MAGNINPSTTDTDVDPEALLETLVEGGVLSVKENAVTTTTEFEDTRGIYRDSYMSVDDDVFHRAVADAFGFESTEVAAERVKALGVTREQLVAYLALKDHLDGSYTTNEVARMAVVVTELGPGTPVPEEVETLIDDTYEGFLAGHERAIVTVWKHHCDPCETMKEEIDAILDAIPDGVVVGGIDGEKCSDFRRTYDIDAAPAMVLFTNGEFQEGYTGRATPERVASACAEVYDTS
jgi:hypothetical protein